MDILKMEAMFVDVNQLVEIAEITFEKDGHVIEGGKRIATGVNIEPYVGSNYVIGRRELINSFRHADGRRVKMSSIDLGKKYIMYKNINRKVKAAYRKKLDDTPHGDAIYMVICDGVCKEVAPELFRKICVIPAGTIASMIGKKKSERYTSGVKSSINIEKIDNVGSNNRINRSSVSEINNGGNNEEINKGKIKAVYRIVDKMDKLVGFGLKWPDGSTKALNIGAVGKLADEQKISNLALVIGENKRTHLRGIGIKIHELPKRGMG